MSDQNQKKQRGEGERWCWPPVVPTGIQDDYEANESVMYWCPYCVGEISCGSQWCEEHYTFAEMLDSVIRNVRGQLENCITSSLAESVLLHFENDDWQMQIEYQYASVAKWNDFYNDYRISFRDSDPIPF